ncbi:hypothetical protein A2U01_0054398, partial [Trifolium medium]|nr:hypothetical protein [Trifolium medium]
EDKVDSKHESDTSEASDADVSFRCCALQRQHSLEVVLQILTHQNLTS